MSIAERFIAVVRNQGHAIPPDVSPNTLVAALNIDSLSFMDMIMRAEEAEDVILSDDEVESILKASYLFEIISVFQNARARS